MSVFPPSRARPAGGPPGVDPRRRPGSVRRSLSHSLCLMLLTAPVSAAEVGSGGAVQAPGLLASAEQPPHRLDLAGAVDWALARNFAVRRAAARVEQNRGDARHARRLVPSNPLVTFRSARRKRPGEAATRDMSIQLAQELWIGGQGRVMTRAADARTQAAQGDLDFLRTTTAARTRAAYLRALVAREGVRSAERALTVTADLARYAVRRLDAGKTTVQTVNTAEIARGRAAAQHARAVRNARRAELDLFELLSADPARDLVLTGRLALPDAIEVPSQERLLNAAVRRRGDLAAAGARVAAARADLALSRRQLIPNLTVFGLYGQEEDFDIAGGGLQLRLPIGHRFGGDRDAARARLREQTLARDAQRLAVRGAVLRALTDYRAARAAADAVGRPVLDRAEDNVRRLQTALAAGKVGAPAITAAQDNLLAVRRDYLDALGDLIDAAAALERATGGLIHAAPAAPDNDPHTTPDSAPRKAPAERPGDAR
ncbi:outer membrane protein TolC [Rhodothalassium salexigens DSM 2132]|uniref:Outer membrane protein TolC n=3 Tax=Rhodothalassium salexigens TaxID=1086 RepID=A0A4R2PTW9_RHOSA|nr:outer membrane protein TolC [Rhodothalassium salexigens DSM 2132]